ncbi:MAG: type II secretion system protein [Pirellulales bacterium]|nr:type II secretion system protein [Pirellulales bacterium]
MGRGCRCGFTLIEVLIVVVIMAVLAAVVIPQVLAPTKDAKQSTLQHNLHVLRSQIELYRASHQGDYPAIESNDLPQLTKATNSEGETGIASPAYPYGPYIVLVPPNPFDGSSEVSAVAVPGAVPTAVSGSLGGWQYDETTGGIWPNHPGYFE